MANASSGRNVAETAAVNFAVFTCSAAVILLFRPLLFREESTFFNSLGSKNGLKRAIRPDRTAVG